MVARAARRFQRNCQIASLPVQEEEVKEWARRIESICRDADLPVRCELSKCRFACSDRLAELQKEEEEDEEEEGGEQKAEK